MKEKLKNIAAYVFRSWEDEPRLYSSFNENTTSFFL
jgi:hypothetical protein